MGEVRTLFHVIREIERLRLLVKELEEQLKNHNRSNSGVASLPTPAVSSTAVTPVNFDPLREHGGSRKY